MDRDRKATEPNLGPFGTESLGSGKSSKNGKPSGCVLYVSEGCPEDKGRHLRLERGRARVGSSSGCDLRLHDAAVSREHLELSVLKDGVLVADLQSTNGTFYLRQRIDRLVVSVGARVHLGRSAIDIMPLEGGEWRTPLHPRSLWRSGRQQCCHAPALRYAGTGGGERSPGVDHRRNRDR